ncbi:hypothetical protein [Winogradskyella sp. 3972H.M.0a.05]|uniref:hypothetical protein n=1 Tax=Winogradskyella sp. 3972H.M.0a.05 TaxID=2950277 RepID=UPI00339B1622
MSKSSRLRHLSSNTTNNSASSKQSNIKWRTIFAIVLMYIAIVMNWEWVWGILFLIWVVPDLFRGVTYFIEPIAKDENPVLYWIIVLTWLLMSVYSLSTLFIDWNNY